MEECGSTVAHIDDCTFSVGCDTTSELNDKLSEEYTKLSSYMSSN